jgi:VCBS repeat-containing protein
VALSGATVVAGSYNDDGAATADQGSAYIFSIENSAPEARDDIYEAEKNTALTIEAPGVLGNDSDADADSLTAVLVSQPAHGTVTLSQTGSFIYTPSKRFTGDDTFTYKANDGTADSKAVTVTIAVDRKVCPASRMYGHASPQAAALRRFRDEVLAASAPGRAVIGLYYAAAPLLDGLLEASPRVEQAARALADKVLLRLERR